MGCKKEPCGGERVLLVLLCAQPCYTAPLDNPARKAVAVEKESRWQVEELF